MARYRECPNCGNSEKEATILQCKKCGKLQCKKTSFLGSSGCSTESGIYWANDKCIHCGYEGTAFGSPFRELGAIGG